MLLPSGNFQNQFKGNRLRTERRRGVWHTEGPESDGVGGRGVVEMFTESGRKFEAVARKEKIDAARHRQ